MSIPVKISQLVIATRLRSYSPAFVDPDFVALRTVLMTEDVFTRCPAKGPSTDAKIKGISLAGTRALLMDFVGGKMVEEGFHLKRLAPFDKDIWELRVTQPPAQQVRVIGWLPVRDVFVAVRIRHRDDLGDYGDPCTLGESYRLVSQEFLRSCCDDHSVFGLAFSDYVSNGVLVSMNAQESLSFNNLSLMRRSNSTARVFGGKLSKFCAHCLDAPVPIRT